jgi:hypothetical protein
MRLADAAIILKQLSASLQRFPCGGSRLCPAPPRCHLAIGPGILLRADSHYAAPEVFDWWRANGVDWLFGLAPNPTLSRHVTALAKSTLSDHPFGTLDGDYSKIEVQR